MVIKELNNNKLIEYNVYSIQKADGRYEEIKTPIRTIADFDNPENIMKYLRKVLAENKNNPLG